MTVFLHDPAEDEPAALRFTEGEVILQVLGEVSADLLFAKDRQGRMLYANPAALALIGRPKEEVIGRTAAEWLADPAQAEAVMQADRRIMARGVRETLEEPVTDGLSGELRLWQSVKTPFRDPGTGDIVGLIGVSRDITQARRAEQALAESEARFRAAVKAISGIVWTNSPRGEMAGEQPGWAALTGQTYEEYRGLGWSRAIHPEDTQLTVEAWNQAVARRETFVFEHRVRRQDGVWRRFAVRAVPLVHDGTVLEWVGIHTDVTDQRQAEAVLARDRIELEQLVRVRTRDLQETQSRLAQAEKLTALGQLAGGIAHDFNNVMQVVQGSAGLIRRYGKDHPAIERYVTIIEDAAQRGTSVTRRLLAFAHRGELQAAPIDVPLMLDGLREVLTHTLHVGVKICMDAADTIPAVIADRGQLEAALVNLATNARDAMPDGGTLTLSATEEVAAAGHPHGLALGRYVRLSLTDTGMGMDSLMLARVMEPFFTTKPRGEGTGLGLPMARGFAEKSGGAFALTSEPGCGTRVDLWLPVAAEGAGHFAGPVPLAGPHVWATPPKVLLVDDEDLVREVLAAQLEDSGFDVVPVSGSAAALRVLDADEHLDVLVSDLAMPAMDGIALIKAAQTRRGGLPAILLTGNAGDVMSGVADDDGCFSLLRKPVSGADLSKAVAAVLTKVAPGQTANRVH